MFIYGLVDPKTNIIRYIGKTKNPLYRLKQHLYPSSLRGISHKNYWIKSLLKNNCKPILIIIEEVTDIESSNREIYWIDFYKSNNLVNSTYGGEGGELSDIAKNNISKSLLGKPKSVEHRKSLAEAKLGKPGNRHTNRGIKNRNASSKYLGVSYLKPKKRFKAYIRYNGENIFIGSSKDEIIAAKMYDTKARELYGMGAKVNFNE